MNSMLHGFMAWVSDPVNAVLLATTVTSAMQALAAETGWRWAVITCRVLESLPCVINAKGLATAGRKQ